MSIRSTCRTGRASVLLCSPAGVTNLVPSGGLLFNDGAVVVAYIRAMGRLLTIMEEILDL
jgi:hypothetical protein